MEPNNLMIKESFKNIDGELVDILDLKLDDLKKNLKKIIRLQ